MLGALGAGAFGAATNAAVNLNFRGLRWRGLPRGAAAALDVIAIGFPAASATCCFCF